MKRIVLVVTLSMLLSGCESMFWAICSSCGHAMSGYSEHIDDNKTNNTDM